MQYVVTAMDHTDSEALFRRMAHREAHLAGLRKMIAEGSFLSGGAILDAENRMIGSPAHVEFSTRVELDAWLKSDPYTEGKVWDRIEVREIRLLPVNQFKRSDTKST